MAGPFLLGENMRKIYKSFATSLAIDVFCMAICAASLAYGLYEDSAARFFLSLLGITINAILLKLEIEELVSYIMRLGKINDM